jgi:hypothetical protein
MQITTRLAVWFCVSPHCNNGRIFVQLDVDVLIVFALPIIRPQRSPKAKHATSRGHSVSVLRHWQSNLYALRYSHNLSKSLSCTRSVRYYHYSCVTFNISFIPKIFFVFLDLTPPTPPPPPNLQPTTKSHRLRNTVGSKHTRRQDLCDQQAPITISAATKEWKT